MAFQLTRLQAAASLLALAGALGAAVPAAAQGDTQSKDSEAADDGEIVVTAQFRDQNLQDVPLAITAVTGDTLEARGQTNLADLGGSAPNVTLRQTPATYGPAVVAYIRGVGQRDTTFALEPGVGLYVDDVYLPTLHGSMLNLVDLDRVEILRGPQGTLAGQNSIGGAIKLYSKKPDDSTDGYLSATIGSFNRVEVKGATNFTLVPDTLYARISAAGVHKDGYVTRYDYACTHPGSTVPTSVTGNGCKLGTEGGKDYVAARLALRWKPSSSITVDLAGDVTEDNSEPGPTTLIYVGRNAVPGAMLTGVATPASAAYVLNGNVYGTSTGSQFISYSPYGNFAQDTFSHSPYTSYENYTDLAPRDGTAAWQAPLKSAIDSWGLSATISADLADKVNLTSITSYRKFDGVYSSADGSPLSPTIQANQIFNRQFSQEVRLSAELADIIHVTVGGFYFHKRSRNRSRVTLTTLNFIEDNSIPATTKAAFINAEVTPIENLTLVGGLRYTDQKKQFIYGRLGIPGSSTGGAVPASLAPLNGLVGEYSGDRFDYRVAAQYRFTDGLMAYAQFSTGFKGGGINPRPFFPAQALPHGPETLDAYEAGFKSDFFDRKVRLNASAFINKYNDILVSVSSCPLTGAPATPCALPLNAGKATVKGFETELSLRPVRGLSIDASLAYLNFKYTSISAIAATAGIGLEDKGVYISPWQWSIGAQYQIEAPFGTITPRVDMTHEDAFNRNANNVDAATGGVDVFGLVQGRTLVNARLSFVPEGSDWEFSAEVRNLTDKFYYTDIFDNRGSTNSIQGSPAEPRTWALTIKRRF
ncbi:TonB-dependent receptor [Sphingomonas canadensis]|uniref:TonB-dependent receptor n=1 Tax=Sphingomonas canadensis TaxID=1219257 RepID=A0ABW3HB59_9SPHN|nr:TonB-dependent receptor [Sphingomonas canadensis]MCW3837637.1 TonB-dependent receptor [Sphingomonas canadensis]